MRNERILLAGPEVQKQCRKLAADIEDLAQYAMRDPGCHYTVVCDLNDIASSVRAAIVRMTVIPAPVGDDD